MAPRTVQRFTPPTALPARRPIVSDVGDTGAGLTSPGAPPSDRRSAPAGTVTLLAGGAAIGWSLLVAPAPAQAASEAGPPTEADAASDSPQSNSTSLEGPVAAPSPFWSSTAADGFAGPDALPPGGLTVPGEASQSPGAPQQEPARGPMDGRIAQSTLTVRAGESLWSLTGDLLGPTATEAQIAEQWPLLWEANADRIRDPDRVLAGTVLLLPRTLLPEP